MSEFDIFIKNSIYPKAEEIFSSSNQPLDKVKKDCLFVVDTNALLVPYFASSQDLEQIKLIYSSLIERSRFYIPGQVAREFASNRPDKIKELFQQLTKRQLLIQDFKFSSYPLLNNIEEYQKLLEIENEYNNVAHKFKKQYKLQLDKVLEIIKNWSWNDPVSELYKNLFTKHVIYDLIIEDKESLKSEMERRYKHKIPPGYKDQSKSDDGIGDLLIWFTILEIAKKFKKSIVFVSGEEKSDWIIKSEGQILYPRFELMAEFNLAAPGLSFHIIKLSQFIELSEGSTKLIKEIKEIESNLSISSVDTALWLIRDLNDPIVSEILLELDNVKKSVIEFVSKKDPLFTGKENFMDDLTQFHRTGVITFDLYKRLMNFYAIYNRRDNLPDDVHLQNLQEIRVLKNLIYEAVANLYI